MESYKKEFIEFMVESDVLKFGDFTLKSGRKSPFFMNAGAYVTGKQLRKLGEYYAKAIYDNYGLDFDVLFGPAYKGIPLAVATTMANTEAQISNVQAQIDQYAALIIQTEEELAEAEEQEKAQYELFCSRVREMEKQVEGADG